MSRLRVEHGLRVTAWVALAWLGWVGVAPAGRRTGLRVVDGGTLAAALPRWTTRPEAESLHVTLAEAPSAAQRDWLRSLARTGSVVTWSGGVLPLAIEVEPSGDPAGGLRVRVAAPTDAMVVLRDTLGIIDSLRVSRGGASFALEVAPTGLTALAEGQSAHAPRTTHHAPLTTHHAPRTIALLARASWESKFLLAALEERGWTVDARLALSPALAVTQGRPLPLDTARHAAVIVLDSVSAADAAQVARFVRRGGGAVLGAGASRTGPLADIAPAVVLPRERAVTLSLAGREPRLALGFDRLLPRADALVLERRGAIPAIAARRLGAGRVVQVGYDETWRWRMAGDDGASEAHGAWWAALVAGAAYQPASAVPPFGADPAPLASLTAAIGAARPAPVQRAAPPDPRRLIPLAFGLWIVSLLAEWTSRRLRGAP